MLKLSTFLFDQALSWSHWLTRRLWPGGYVVFMVLALGGSSPSQAQTGTPVAGSNGPGAAANQLNNPSGVFVDGAGNVFVADALNHRIQQFVLNRAPVATANNNQTATVGVAFSYPVNAFTDPEGQPLTYSASISPANGFVFNPATRIISGTPGMSGVSSVTATDPGSLSTSTTFTITVSEPPSSIRYVRMDATGSGNSWADASGDLQSQINVTGAQQVWVATGTYKPGGNANTDRNVSFAMKNGVAIYGGFPATGSPGSLTARNPDSFTTVLSGDIGVVGNNADNSLHVFFNPDGLTVSAVLDGAVIRDGNANGSGIQGFGGGMYNRNSGPTLTNCSFLSNTATTGGGMYNVNSSPTLNNCRFQGNTAIEGGGMYNRNSGPTLTNCSFLSNTATTGGGMRNSSSSPALNNCRFQGNTAIDGGGMYNIISSPTLTNCSFVGNIASSQGGGIYNSGERLFLTNCSFVGNSANLGGGICSNNTLPTLTNCSFVGNSAARQGGGMYNGNGTNATLTNCSFQGNTASELGRGMYNFSSRPTLTNCVLFGNGGANTFFNENNSLVTATYSLLETGVTGYTDGGNNLTTSVSPFVSPTDARLNGCAPAIDAGNNGANGTATDLDGNPRFANTIIDMGAYEFQGQRNFPTGITQQPPSGSLVCQGSTVSIPLSVSGTGAFTYQLVTAMGTPVGPSQSTTPLTLATVQPAQSGSYSVIVTGACNSVTSTAFSLAVNVPPVATLTASPSTVLNCAQTSLTLTAGGGTGYTFSGPGILSQSGNQAVINAPGTYSVTVTNAGCTSTTSITISQDTTAPLASLVSSGTLTCAVTSVTLTANPNGLSYVFSNGANQLGTTNQTVVNTAGAYSVTVVSANGCSAIASVSVSQDNMAPSLSINPSSATLTCTSPSMSLTVVGNGSVRWDDNSTNAVRTVSSSGTYSVTLTGANGCVASASATVTASSDLTATISGSLTVCPGQSTILTASGGSSYRWSTGETTASITAMAGTYSVTVSSGSCSASTSTTVSGAASPTATISGSLTVVPGGTTTLTATGGSSLTWSTGQTTVSITVPAGAYSVIVANGSGCTSTTSVTVTTGNTAPTVANAVGPQSATVGVAYTLSLANTFTDAETLNSLTLSVAGLPASLTLSGTSISGTPSTTVGSPFSITVTATDPDNLSTSTVFVLSVSPAASPAPFAITGVTTIDCTPLSNRTNITFNSQYAGLTGSPVSFQVLNELAPTTNPGPYSLTLYPDNPVITLRAVQNGVSSSFSYNWLAACNSLSMTPGGNTPPTVANAIPPQSATVGQGFRYVIPANTFTDAQTPNALALSVTGLPAGLIFTAPATISGTPSVSGVSSVTVTATDPGNLSGSTSFVLTVSPAVSTTTPSAFALTGVMMMNCTPVANRVNISFNPQYTGLNGSPISFQVVNELAPTTDPGPYSLSLYPDNPVITLKAIQRGVSSSFTYNWLTACNSLSTTPGANTPPTVANAVGPQSATVGVGYTLSLANTFTDAETPNTLVLSAAGLPCGLSLSGTTLSGTPSMSGTSTVTVTATDPGNLSVSTTFTITVNPASTTGTPTGTFALTGVTTGSCTVLAPGQRSVTFNPRYTGLDGTPVSFQVVNELAATTNPGPYTLALYTDNPVITLRVVQAGVSSSFAYNWLEFCRTLTMGSRQASNEPMADLSVRVLGNPVAGETVSVEIRGGEGQWLRLTTTDSRGRMMSEQTVGEAKAIETQTIRVGPDAGVYMLQVSTPTQVITTKIMKR